MLKLNTKDQGIFFSSDFHWSHANICRGTSTWKSFEDGSSHQSVRDFDTVEEMNAAILKGINDKVGPDDILFFLGDWSFKNIDQIWDLRKQINCKNIHFIFGNHDEKIEADRLYTIPSEDVEKHEDLVLAANAFEYQTGSTISGTVAYLQNLFTSVGYYNEISIDGQRICMSHYAMRVWNKSHHGSWMLYGHCIDEGTEVLTTCGWKNYQTLTLEDTIYSYNPRSNYLEESKVKNKFVYPKYSGEMYNLDHSKMSFSLTKGHKFVGYNRSNKWVECPIEELKGRSYMIRSGVFQHEEYIALSDDELRLYICLVADGSIVNTTLGRLKVSKEYKLKYFKDLLDRLCIQFTENTHKDGATCLNFQIPILLQNLNIKGLDVSLLNIKNRHQIEVILYTYRMTDGNINMNGRTTTINTSKREEVDLLQHLFITNGYLCSYGERVDHGFSTGPSYTLTVTPKNLQLVDFANIKIESVENKLTWCIETKLGNFMCRRNGKAYITGNSHSTLEATPWGKSMDVGIDNYFRLNGEYKPFSFQEIRTIMNTRDVAIVDHHNSETN